MKRKIKCMWLNKSFGDDYWICDGLLKPTNRKICEECNIREETGPWLTDDEKGE